MKLALSGGFWYCGRQNSCLDPWIVVTGSVIDGITLGNVESSKSYLKTIFLVALLSGKWWYKWKWKNKVSPKESQGMIMMNLRIQWPDTLSKSVPGNADHQQNWSDKKKS